MNTKPGDFNIFKSTLFKESLCCLHTPTLPHHSGHPLATVGSRIQQICADEVDDIKKGRLKKYLLVFLIVRSRPVMVCRYEMADIRHGSPDLVRPCLCLDFHVGDRDPLVLPEVLDP